MEQRKYNYKPRVPVFPATTATNYKSDVRFCSQKRANFAQLSRLGALGPKSSSRANTRLLMLMSIAFRCRCSLSLVALTKAHWHLRAQLVWRTKITLNSGRRASGRRVRERISLLMDGGRDGAEVHFGRGPRAPLLVRVSLAASLAFVSLPAAAAPHRNLHWAPPSNSAESRAAGSQGDSEARSKRETGRRAS